jgi:hypothetical protein
MKTYRSSQEGVWTTPAHYPLTEAETVLLNSEDSADDVAKETLKETIIAFYATNPSEEISTEVVETLNTIYNLHKPEVGRDETYELIGATITLRGEEVSGLINCRPVILNADGTKQLKEQYQIRF